MNSSCGVCGRANLEALADLGVRARATTTCASPITRIYELPERMREAQRIFATTGGLHAAALFDRDRQDASRCARISAGTTPSISSPAGRCSKGARWRESILFVSGRASYEILQKAAVARIPIVCAVSAPSSLAVDLARAFNITLVAFVRGEHANVYSASERSRPISSVDAATTSPIAAGRIKVVAAPRRGETCCRSRRAGCCVRG